MPKKWPRFPDLKARGLVDIPGRRSPTSSPTGLSARPHARPQHPRLDRRGDRGVRESRPIAGPPPRGAAKVAKSRPPKDRQRKTADEAAAT